MIGRLSKFKWTDKQEHSRDLIFVIIILGFGIMLTARLAPHYKDLKKSVILNTARSTQNIPKSLVDQINAPLTRLLTGNAAHKNEGSGWEHSARARQAPSIAERPLFDGQTVLLTAKLLTPFSSEDERTPIEAAITGIIPSETTSDVDFSPCEAARLLGTGKANFSVKRLTLGFTEMVGRDGKSYGVIAQAIDPSTRVNGVEGDFSSGLGTRIAGIALERLIMAADQVGMAKLFSATIPTNQPAQQFETAAMETNQEASASISGAATEDLRETKAKITLQPGFEFQVRIKDVSSGVNTP